MSTAKARDRSWWGWGFVDEALGDEELEAVADVLARRFPTGPAPVLASVPEVTGLDLPPVTIVPPASLRDLCSEAPGDRAAHTYGKSFRDVVRALAGDVAAAPDLVVRPRAEQDVADVLEWCAGAGIAVVPYGGGSSVVGGVEGGAARGQFAGVVSLDLQLLAGVVEVDRTSRAARVRAGTFGPDLEDALRPHRLTLRHFPQSFEHSTLGGWVATRAGGHFATNYTHIDDFVESLRTVTPAGVLESRRLPGSGAGPAPDRLVLGSEGILGVVTEAWVRLQDRPVHRATAAVRFPSFAAGAEAARSVVQAGLFPANCRLLDPEEAAGSGGEGSALLLLGFESAMFPVDGLCRSALERCLDHGGAAPDGIRSSSTEGAPGAWRSSFFRAPYLRDGVARLGWIAETFETAVTWERFPMLHAAVSDAVHAAVGPGGGSLTCRFTHVYPDGPAPYFTVLAPSERGRQLGHWQEIKDAASEVILSSGGTITHHHAVGRDHRPWYDRQRPDLFAEALAATKARLDPSGVLNPGVLIGPVGA
ncbi:MAG: FAD-binding oxidoreductase [Actinomycetota bacterium]|nr:FAD-binding oxidoreductase [Actinomycetota bacterium]